MSFLLIKKHKTLESEADLHFFIYEGFSAASFARVSMKKTCPNCNLINFGNAANCARCQVDLTGIFVSAQAGLPKKSFKSKFLKRATVCVTVVIFTLLAFYLSLLLTSKKLIYDERKSVESAIGNLEKKGFADETFLLNYLTAFRSNDHWLNASVEKENAYAATNFPFEIMTLYPNFFTASADETERAAILLHEAQHLKGADEKEAYEFVWKNRKTLGWTKETHGNSIIWRNVRKQTKEYAPNLFVCGINNDGDCTE